MKAEKKIILFGVSLILLSCDRDLVQITNENQQTLDKNQSLQKVRKDSLNLNGEANSLELENINDPNDEGPKVPPRK